MSNKSEIIGQTAAAEYIGSSQQYISELVKKGKLNPETFLIGKLKVQFFAKDELNKYHTGKKKKR